ncbi:MAG: ABC transporter substrate-binding protein [Alphaproteobacteria bacterium]|nr:ABC transporter substrate-binding protein [Alphaproteobacteria bacterium]MBN2780016.1 ABC transporter substrate-binding protein [Alphaproteobacteria bacterium]
MKTKLLLLTILITFFTSSIAPAKMSEGNAKKAYTFVEGVYKKINTEILNTKISREKKYILVRDILIDKMDIQKISTFILGQHWKKATQHQKDAFKTLFVEFQIQRFTNILNSYDSQEISMIGTEKSSGKEQVFVNMKVTDKKDQKKEPIEIKWRIYKAEEGFRIVDVIISGISMSLTLKNDYNALIKKATENGHNGMDSLIAELDKKIKVEESGGETK